MSGKLGGIYESFLTRSLEGARKEQEAFREVVKVLKYLIDLANRGNALGLQAGWVSKGVGGMTEQYRKGMEDIEKDLYSVLPLLKDRVKHREEILKLRKEELDRQREQEAAALEDQVTKAESILQEAKKALSAAQKVAEEAEKKKQKAEAQFKKEKEEKDGGGYLLLVVLGVCLLIAIRRWFAWLVFIPLALFYYKKIYKEKKGWKSEMEKTLSKLAAEARTAAAPLKQRMEEVNNAKLTVLAANLSAEMIPIPGKNFMMGKYEVTQAQWEAVMDKNPAHFKGSDKPVENVSWNDCQEFLRKLNALPAAKESGWVFRLPTEEEWEFACRAGATGDYSRLADGTEITKDTLGQVAWFEDNSAKKTHPVGQKKPNAFGLYDMHGNVWEWTSTFGHWEDIRVACGGCWDSSADLCQSCGRDRRGPPSSTYKWVGFRLAMSMSE